MRCAALVATTAILAFASAGSAAGQPKGEFAPFAACPLKVPTITDCIHTRSNAGEVSVGRKSVPLTSPVIVQGGAEGGGEELTFYHAENGETLVNAPQPVPGGLRGVTPTGWWPDWMTEWYEEALVEDETEVTATVELASPDAEVKLNTENLLTQQGTALGLPVRIRLQNPVLGSNCRIGSSADPIQLNLTTGRSGSLKGTTGKVSFNKETTLSTVRGARMVDETYALPEPTGCGGLLSYFLDPLVEEILGLPSPAGKSTAILEGEFQDAQAEAVRASE